MVGPELFCPDRSNGTISLYLVRPLRATDYAIARWAALTTVVVLIAWLPQLVLLAGLVLGAPDPGSYLADNWSDIPRFLIAGVVIAIYVSTIPAMAAAFAKSRAYAAAFLVGLLVLSAAVIGGLTDTLSDSAGHWVALLSVSDMPLYVNDVIFGEQTSSIEAAADLSNIVQVGWYVIIVAAAGAIFLGRYRRLSL